MAARRLDHQPIYSFSSAYCFIFFEVLLTLFFTTTIFAKLLEAPSIFLVLSIIFAFLILAKLQLVLLSPWLIILPAITIVLLL